MLPLSLQWLPVALDHTEGLTMAYEALCILDFQLSDLISYTTSPALNAAPTTPAFLLSFKHTKQASISGPLHLLEPSCLRDQHASLSHFLGARLNCHVLSEALPDHLI